MKTSWQRIFTFGRYVGGHADKEQTFPGWMEKNPEETKFRIAVKRVFDQIADLQQTFQQKKADIEMEHCATMPARVGDPDSPKIIVRGEKGELCYTLEGERAKQKAVNDLVAAEDFEIEPYYVSDLPKLNEMEIGIFTGFVVSPEQAESLNQKEEAIPGNGHLPQSEARELAVI